MANSDQIKILKQGVRTWNKWRDEVNEIMPDLSGADLYGANLHDANLSGADLCFANLCRADLINADLSGAQLNQADLSSANLRSADLFNALLFDAIVRSADLSGANLSNAAFIRADLHGANLYKANLRRTNLSEANLYNSDLTKANLTRANLNRTFFVETILEGADLSNSYVYGISAWNLKTNQDTKQRGLVVTDIFDQGEPKITVDNLEIAQFIYLLLNRRNLRTVLNTITSKSVLLLGRFTPERKAVLDAIANELRKNNLLPIIFDFERSTALDFTETIKVLAGMSLFVIADITNPKSAPLELQATVPDYQIPFVPIIEKGEKPFSMFSDFPKYDWVLTPVVEYPSLKQLLKGFKKVIIDRAWKKHQELQKSKAQKVQVFSIEDFTTADRIKQTTRF